MAVGGDGDAAAQVGHHQIQVLVLATDGLGVFVRGGPGVEHVAEAGAGDLFKAGDPGLGDHLVAGHGIVDIGGDAERRSDLAGQQAAEV